MPSRRSVLATTAAAVAATGGCLYDHPDPTPTPNCAHASVVPLRIERRGTPPDDGAYAVVELTVDELPAPALIAELQTCDGNERERYAVTETGTRRIEFGPYDCIDGISLHFDGCED
ncbi:hypothetical protein DM867_09495 [Halosegnis rubeus]|jgi:hypothetical protein|uniref:Uncharacterized protein n=1 Tax=Halosegnis rubeus TaxID=2212850 RepID=A0A5N5U615_9EURY|nr:hypothetical protein [Halosegnis rubeus]KAB7514005.1 hypothetical protein DM867_09495 [Halosegnis rubeus]KAB7514402.1 hypothetical protein DMP03_11130 [Halosegnis rubeus]KAB7518683.1 hypothetical protein DP108_05780 [Halosegnis rubeus]